MEVSAWRSAIVLLIALSVAAAAPSPSPLCHRPSLYHAALGSTESCSPMDSPAYFNGQTGVVEGDEAALHRALNLVYKNKGSYVALLFYASWCPFSKIFRTKFPILSSLFPTVGHFAFEEALVRPSILSRYGVHGFPTLFLLNSTMRVRYLGPRTIDSLIAFYNDVTGHESEAYLLQKQPEGCIYMSATPYVRYQGMLGHGIQWLFCFMGHILFGVNPAALDPMYVEKIVSPSNNGDASEFMEQENCPFSWARSPEKLLQQDTYLALASCFVLLRLLYFLLPKLSTRVLGAWRRKISYGGMVSLWSYWYTHIEHAKQSFFRLNPCKRSNLRGAMNAGEWASKSLVSVSLGEPSSGRAYSRSERR